MWQLWRGMELGREVMREAIKVLARGRRQISGAIQHHRSFLWLGGIDAAGERYRTRRSRYAKKSDAGFIRLCRLPDSGFDSAKGETAAKRAALLRLRKEFQLFREFETGVLWKELAHACPLAKERHGDGIDILVVRELTGGLYFWNAEVD